MAFTWVNHVRPNHMLPIYWVTYVPIYEQELDVKQQPYLKRNPSRCLALILLNE